MSMTSAHRGTRGLTLPVRWRDTECAHLLWGRSQYGWRGRTAIRWTLGGFIFLLLSYFGSKFILEIILG